MTISKRIGPGFQPIAARAQGHGGAPRSTMRYRPDIGCDATDGAYAQMLANPHIGRPVSTRDSAPTKVDTPIDLKGVLNGAAKALNEHAANLPTTRDDAAGSPLDTPKAREEARLGPLYQAFEIARGYDRRLRALEQARLAQAPARVVDAKPCPCGKTPCACSNMKDAPAMKTQNLGLAPRSHLTFPTKTRDQQFGEPAPGRFTSQEADRMARYLPEGSAGPASAHETGRADMALEHPTYFGERGIPQAVAQGANANLARFKGNGASGQLHESAFGQQALDAGGQRDDSAGMLRLAAEARGGAARINTPYSLDGSDGRGSKGENAVNVRGAPGDMARADNPAEAFASELSKIPSGQVNAAGNINAAQNILNAHMSKARDGAARDAIEKVWRDFVANYGKRK